MINLTDPNHEAKLAHDPNHKQWVAGQSKEGHTYIDDENFEYDARLYINGDFPNNETKLKYAESIAEVLNQYND